MPCAPCLPRGGLILFLGVLAHYLGEWSNLTKLFFPNGLKPNYFMDVYGFI